MFFPPRFWKLAASSKTRLICASRIHSSIVLFYSINKIQFPRHNWAFPCVFTSSVAVLYNYPGPLPRSAPCPRCLMPVFCRPAQNGRTTLTGRTIRIIGRIILCAPPPPPRDQRSRSLCTVRPPNAGNGQGGGEKMTTTGRHAPLISPRFHFGYGNFPLVLFFRVSGFPLFLRVGCSK